MQQVIKERDGNVLTSEGSVLREWKACFEELVNVENESDEDRWRTDNQKDQRISKEEVKAAMNRMTSGGSWSR